MSIPETDPGCQTTEEKNMAIFSMILSLLCGVALFLFGMSLMGDGLKMVAGNKLEAFLYRMTNTPLKGVALGTGVTSVIQSSSATTVMVIGFVNSGMMKLKQAIGIIPAGSCVFLILEEAVAESQVSFLLRRFLPL